MIPARVLLIGAGMLGYCFAANPSSAADPAAGRKLAEQWCARCHNIEKGAPFKLTPPSFASVVV